MKIIGGGEPLARPGRGTSTLFGESSDRTPTLQPRTFSATEGRDQGMFVLTFLRIGAKNPTAVSIVSQTPAGAFQMNPDGVTLEHGPTPITFDTNPTAAVTVQFSDDKGGPYQFSLAVAVTQVVGTVGVTPYQTSPAPYLKVVRDEPYSYDLGQHFAGWDTIGIAPGSPALPAGLTLSGAGVLSGTATVAGMNQTPVLRLGNAPSGTTADFALLLSVAQRPGDLPAPALTELTSTSFRITKPTLPANTPAITSIDILRGPTLPLTTTGGTLVFNGYPGGNTTFDVTVSQAGSTRHVALRAKVLWGDGTTLTAKSFDAGTFTPNVSSITLTGANTAPAYQTQPSISPASGPVGTVFSFTGGTVSGQPTPTSTLIALTQNGIDVLASVVAGQFTSTEAGPLVATWQATNGVLPNATAQATAQIATVAQAPGQMAAPTGTAISATQIDVTLAAAPASDGGSSITSYELRYSLDQQNWTVIAGLAVGETHSLLGLLASTTYFIQNAARNSAGLGPWSTSLQRTTSAASGTTISFGQYTAVGAGAKTISEANGTYGQFTVTAGVITPNVSPLAVGQVTVGSTTINVTAGEYSVASLAEFAAAKTHMGSAGGRTIRFRAGSYSTGTDYVLASANYAAPASVTGEAGAILAGNLKLTNPTNFGIFGLEIHCTDTSRFAVIELSGACAGLRIEDNYIHGVTRDPLGDYSAAGAYQNPDKGIGCTSGTQLNGCSVKRNRIEHVKEGIVLLIGGASPYDVWDNDIGYTYSDATKIAIYAAGALTAPKRWRRNWWYMMLGRQDDASGNGPHSDFLQEVGTAFSSGQVITGLEFTQNSWLNTSLSRGYNIQGLFSAADGLARRIWKDPIVAGNEVMSDTAHFISILADGGVFAHNVLLTTLAAKGGAPFGKFSGQGGFNVQVNGATPLLLRNVTNIAPVGGPFNSVDNILLGSDYATIPISTAFAGANTAAFEANTWETLLASYAIKAGGPLDLAFGRGAIGTGIGTWGARRDPSGWTYNPVFEQANPGVVQPLSVDLMPFDGYVFDAGQSQTVAAVRISGKGTSGQTIQVRGASAGGNTAWVSTTVDMVGNWVATVTVPVAQWGNWYSTEARIGTDDLTKVTEVTRLWGCGHVVGILGQSQNEHVMSVHSTYSSGYTFPALAAENFAMMTQSLAVAGNTLQTRRYTAASAVLGQINVAMAALANTLHLGLPGRKWLIVDLSEAGTSRAHLFWDGETTRRWTDLAAMVDLVRAGGSDIGAIIEAWQGDDAAAARTWCLEWSPFYIGQRWGGGAFAVGTVNPDSVWNNSKTVDHILWDCEAPSDQYGRGIFTRDRTKLLFAEFPPSNTSSTTTDQQNFTSVGGPTLRYDRPARDQLRLFSADPRTPCPAGLQGWAIHIADFSADVHPARNGAIWGVPQFGEQFTAPMLAWGGYNISVPKIIGTETAADGSYADVIVDLPANATLTTTRVLRALADPASPGPHYQPGGPIGFEIRRLGDSDGQRQAVWATSQTGKSAAYQATVMFADTGSGVWPNRRGRVRITPTQPFVAGDMIEYGRGEAMGVLVEPRDTDAQDWLDLLIAHVPALYDAAAEHRYHGAGVQPQPPLLTLSTNAGSTAPSAFTVGQWTLADKATNGALTLTLTALPANGGAAITDVQYQIGAGNWISLGSTALTAYTISGLTNGVSASVKIRAVNSVGASAASDTKSATPTGEVVAPTLSMSTPADNATGVATSLNIDLTFSEAVAFGTGNIVLRKNTAGTWSDAEVFDVATEQGTGNGLVSIAGAVLTINPTAALDAATEYAIRIAGTAIKDLANNAFAGIANDTALSFTTAAASADVAVVQSAIILNHNASLTNSFTSSSFNVGSGASRALHFRFTGTVQVSSSSTAAPTISATFNGQTVTIFGYRYIGSDRSWIAEGYLANPTSGPGTLSFTTSTAQYSMGVIATEMTSAHQSTLPVVRAGGTTSTSPLTMTGTTVAAGSLFLGGIGMCRRSGNPSADIAVTDGTLLATGRSGATDLQSVAYAMGYKPAPTAGAYTMTVTWVGTEPRFEWQTIEVFRA